MFKTFVSIPYVDSGKNTLKTIHVIQKYLAIKNDMSVF